MTNFIRGLLLFLIPLVALGEVHTPSGTLIVMRHLDATELSASPAVLKKYEGTALVVSANSIEFAHQSCRVEKTRQIVSDEEARAFFLRDYKADYSVLKLVAPILIVETDCNIVITDSRQHIVFDWDGDFFEARPPARKKHR